MCEGYCSRPVQGVVTPIVRVGPFATGVKMQSRGQAGFLALVKRSRGLSGSVNGQDQLSPTRIPILQATRTILSTLSRLTSQLPAHALVQTGLTFHPFWNRTPSFSRKRGRGWDIIRSRGSDIETIMDNQLKIVVELHEGEKATKKIWRFGFDLVQLYTKTQLEEEMLSPFASDRSRHHGVAIIRVARLPVKANVMPKIEDNIF